MQARRKPAWETQRVRTSGEGIEKQSYIKEDPGKMTIDQNHTG